MLGLLEPSSYCDRCDLLVGLADYHVLAVDRESGGLIMTIESAPRPMGCTRGGVVAVSHGRRVQEVIDSLCFGRPG